MTGRKDRWFLIQILKFCGLAQIRAPTIAHTVGSLPNHIYSVCPILQGPVEANLVSSLKVHNNDIFNGRKRLCKSEMDRVILNVVISVLERTKCNNECLWCQSSRWAGCTCVNPFEKFSIEIFVPDFSDLIYVSPASFLHFMASWLNSPQTLLLSFSWNLPR